MKTFVEYLEENKVTDREMSLLNEGLQQEWTPELEEKVDKAVDQFLNEYRNEDGELDIEKFKGHEFNFWNNILNFGTFENFVKFISHNFIKKTKERNKFFENQIEKNLPSYDKDCTFITKSSKNSLLLKYFDDYNDRKASSRIINYIENE